MTISAYDAQFFNKLSEAEQEIAHILLDYFGQCFIDHNIRTDTYKLIRSVDVITISKCE